MLAIGHPILGDTKYWLGKPRLSPGEISDEHCKLEESQLIDSPKPCTDPTSDAAFSSLQQQHPPAVQPVVQSTETSTCAEECLPTIADDDQDDLVLETDLGIEENDISADDPASRQILPPSNNKHCSRE